MQQKSLRLLSLLAIAGTFTACSSNSAPVNSYKSKASAPCVGKQVSADSAFKKSGYLYNVTVYHLADSSMKSVLTRASGKTPSDVLTEKGSVVSAANDKGFPDFISGYSRSVTYDANAGCSKTQNYCKLFGIETSEMYVKSVTVNGSEVTMHPGVAEKKLHIAMIKTQSGRSVLSMKASGPDYFNVYKDKSGHVTQVPHSSSFEASVVDTGQPVIFVSPRVKNKGDVADLSNQSGDNLVIVVTPINPDNGNSVKWKSKKGGDTFPVYLPVTTYQK